MKKVFVMENLRMTLEADDAAFDEIAKKAAKACARVDDDCCVILK